MEIVFICTSVHFFLTLRAVFSKHMFCDLAQGSSIVHRSAFLRWFIASFVCLFRPGVSMHAGDLSRNLQIINYSKWFCCDYILAWFFFQITGGVVCYLFQGLFAVVLPCVASETKSDSPGVVYNAIFSARLLFCEQDLY
jgi:hypothetical protein